MPVYGSIAVDMCEEVVATYATNTNPCPVDSSLERGRITGNREGVRI